MPNPLQNAKTFAEKHPFIIAVGAGLVVTAIVIYFRNQSASSTTSPVASNVANCTDQYGNPIDCQSGAPLGNVSSSPSTTGDITTQTQDLEQILSGFEQFLQSQQSTSTTGTSTGTTTTTTTTQPAGIIVPETHNDPISNLASWFYGVTSNSPAFSSVVNSIIGANPALQGDTASSIPTQGSTITLPVVTNAGSTFTPIATGVDPENANSTASTSTTTKKK